MVVNFLTAVNEFYGGGYTAADLRFFVHALLLFWEIIACEVYLKEAAETETE